MDEKRVAGRPDGLADFLAALDALAALGRERRLRREREQQAREGSAQPEGGQGDG
jgi:hypothetical protein